MFTGIVEATGRLRQRTASGGAGELLIETHLSSELALGDSLAVNGTCLTVAGIDTERQLLTFHTLAETLKCTNLGDLQPTQEVNLERPLQLGDRLGGHLVSGHIDGKAELLSWGRRGDDWVAQIELPPALAALAIPKGSIAVDGISLTIAALHPASFTVHIIPHTYEVTNMHGYVPGQLVNLEMDMVGKYILRARTVGGES